jgi:hypothetical protein
MYGLNLGLALKMLDIAAHFVMYMPRFVIVPRFEQ